MARQSVPGPLSMGLLSRVSMQGHAASSTVTPRVVLLMYGRVTYASACAQS